MARELEPIRITTAARSHADDIAGRQRWYLISMGIRTLCFVLAIVSIGHWYAWVLFAASFILPPIAVVVANAGTSPDPGGPELVHPDPTLRALEGPDPATPRTGPAG